MFGCHRECRRQITGTAPPFDGGSCAVHERTPLPTGDVEPGLSSRRWSTDGGRATARHQVGAKGW